MQAALETVDGVEDVEIDYSKKTATVTCKAGTKAKDLITALEDGGYGGSI
ncbi:MAG: hypothetical protein CMJ89_07410 [Planctomycetes bacterium]|nr:hypothetical protein [Planctomycetota bacterium]